MVNEHLLRKFYCLTMTTTYVWYDLSIVVSQFEYLQIDLSCTDPVMDIPSSCWVKSILEHMIINLCKVFMSNANNKGPGSLIYLMAAIDFFNLQVSYKGRWSQTD